MAKYRKLGRTSDQRKALLRNQVTSLIYNGKIMTTEAKAKEIQKIVEGVIAKAVKEKDNYELVKVQAKVAVKDKDGKRVKEVVDGKKVTKYETVEKEIKKDLPSRVHARRQIMKAIYSVTEVPAAAAGKKKGTKENASVPSEWVGFAFNGWKASDTTTGVTVSGNEISVSDSRITCQRSL